MTKLTKDVVDTNADLFLLSFPVESNKTYQMESDSNGNILSVDTEDSDIITWSLSNGLKVV